MEKRAVSIKIKFGIATLLILSLFLAHASYAQTYWGALYIDPNTGIAGGAYNMASRTGAENTARKSCIQKHKGQANNCKYVTAWANGCIAIYWHPDTKKSGYGGSEMNLNQAEVRGYNKCSEISGRGGCKKSLSFCTTMISFY